MVCFLKTLYIAQSYPADIVLALCGDGLVNNFLAADTQENFLHFIYESLQEQYGCLANWIEPKSIHYFSAAFDGLVCRLWQILMKMRSFLQAGSSHHNLNAVHTGPRLKDSMASSQSFLLSSSSLIRAFCSLVSL